MINQEEKNNRLPLISFIVPVYNIEKYLSECCDSIIAQTYTNWECILVDDKSSDSSGKICDSYAKKDTRFKVVHKKINEGLNYARRDGFKSSIGDFVTPIDSDDAISPYFLEVLYKLYLKTGADISSVELIRWLKDTDLPNQKMTEEEIDKEIATARYEEGRDQILYTFMTRRGGKDSYVTCPLRLYKRETWEKIDWQKANFSHGEDLFEGLMFRTFANSTAEIDTPLYYYRERASSIDKVNLNVKMRIPSGESVQGIEASYAKKKEMEEILLPAVSKGAEGLAFSRSKGYDIKNFWQEIIDERFLRDVFRFVAKTVAKKAVTPDLKQWRKKFFAEDMPKLKNNHFLGIGLTSGLVALRLGFWAVGIWRKGGEKLGLAIPLGGQNPMAFK
ncbi:MAG: glycosyltransferase [Candidatus Ancillula sp.]|jgi:glycosyltransferase involved in cell wall biosynthesis|nr:glycosyltransferase [Candidatus Ancillula sp.]